ncbi:hypothetical protein L7F22_020823 [Adiantum nelumboides]|nr:hypothetical protein [Adiantum nelumboides]
MAAAFVERIRCYMHYDDNATSVFVPNPAAYENLVLLEAWFTQGPSNTSLLLGRLQMALLQQPYEDSLVPVAQIFTATFDSILYQGVIAILGCQFLEPSGAEMAIVGGTGRFRLARGFLLFKAPPGDDENYYASMEFYLYH